MALQPEPAPAPAPLQPVAQIAPVAAAKPARPATAEAARTGLFAPQRPAAVPNAAPQAEAPRQSLFSKATGVLGWRHGGQPAAEGQHHAATAEPAAEAPRVSVRQASVDDSTIEIPAFLRRQSS